MTPLELFSIDDRLEVEAAEDSAQFKIVSGDDQELSIILDREQAGMLVKFLVDWLAEGEEGLH